MAKREKEYDPDKVKAEIKKILDNPIWIPELDARDEYSRRDDEAEDDEERGHLTVIYNDQGDICVYTDEHEESCLTFRSSSGGGKSQRTRMALIILAFAILLEDIADSNASIQLLHKNYMLPKNPSESSPQAKKIFEILTLQFWIDDIRLEEQYRRIHEDTDGVNKEAIAVMFAREDYDAYIATGTLGDVLRFRTEVGGSSSPLIRNALIILAYAIKLDNDELPQTR